MAALNGGPDAGLVVEMVERVRPPASLPTQIVAPMPPRDETSEDSGEDTSGASSEEETSGTSEETDTSGQSPPRQRSPSQETRDTVIIIDSESDSDSD